MTELSFSANLAWQMAAQEAATARSEFIESQHILIGIFSLEKILAQDEELDPPTRRSAAPNWLPTAPASTVSPAMNCVTLRAFRRGSQRKSTARIFLGRPSVC